MTGVPKTAKDPWGRYYTKIPIGDLLVAELSHLEPRRILELGAGTGTLARAAINRWQAAELCTVEIDGKAGRRLANGFKQMGATKYRHICADALGSQLPSLVSVERKPFDVAICNPPFTNIDPAKNHYEILESAGFSSCLPNGPVDAALVFLAQNLRLVSKGASIGIILPDSIFSSMRYRAFRTALLQRYLVEKVVRLPIGAFAKTEAQAYIVIIQKGYPTTKSVCVFDYVERGQTASVIRVAPKQAAVRLDPRFQRTAIATRRQQTIELGAVIESLQRGSLSSIEGRLAPFPVLHTTDLSLLAQTKKTNISAFSTATGNSTNLIRAIAGDILVARVGRSLQHQTVGVTQGTAVITDCVYRLQVKPAMRDLVLRELQSEHGKAWLATTAYGVGAKQLTKADLLRFPIRISKRVTQ